MLLSLLLACGGSPSEAPPSPAAPPSSGPTGSRPNVLVITLDTTRADKIGAYGHPAGATPRIDRLAARGTRFDRAYTVTPLTIPAHSSLFTGLYPPRHGVRDNGDHFLGDGADTLAEALQAAGYATMASVGAEVTSHHWGFGQGFDAYFDEMPAAVGGRRWEVERPGEEVVTDALAWLTAQEADDDRPWFSWVHMFDVHHPWTPSPELAKRFRSPYVAELAGADEQVGRLLDGLHTTGELEHTWVLLMSDHGEGLGEHGEGMHGVLLYDATTRIPLVVAPPLGTDAGAASWAGPVSLVDVMPTVLELVGQAVPDDLDGQSLVPVLQGRATPADRAVYAESLYAWHHFGWAPQRALVDPTHALLDSTTPELYARDDRAQALDLADTEPTRLDAMRQRLDGLAAAMEPRADASEERSLSAEQAAQLEALGYMTTSITPVGDAPAGLPDPVDRLPLLAEVERARQALQEDRLADARVILIALLGEEPGLFDSRMLLASVQLKQDDVAAAEATLLEAMAMQPTASQPKAHLAQLRLRQGRVDEARALASEALEIDPLLESARVLRLYAMFLAGDVAGLRVEVPATRAVLPDSPIGLAMDGLLDALDRDPAGIPKLEAALQADPRQPLARMILGAAWYREGRVDLALPLLQEEVERFPPAVPALELLARIHAERKDWPAQQQVLEAMVAVGAPDPLELHALAQARFNQGAYAEALADVEACLAIDELPVCTMLKANALKKLGRDADAQRAYERAMELAAGRRDADGRRRP